MNRSTLVYAGLSSACLVLPSGCTSRAEDGEEIEGEHFKEDGRYRHSRYLYR